MSSSAHVAVPGPGFLARSSASRQREVASVPRSFAADLRRSALSSKYSCIARARDSETSDTQHSTDAVRNKSTNAARPGASENRTRHDTLEPIGLIYLDDLPQQERPLRRGSEHRRSEERLSRARSVSACGRTPPPPLPPNTKYEFTANRQAPHRSPAVRLVDAGIALQSVLSDLKSGCRVFARGQPRVAPSHPSTAAAWSSRARQPRAL